MRCLPVSITVLARWIFLSKGGYVDVGPYAGSVRVSVAKRRRRGWVHFPLPVPVSRVKPSSRVHSLVIAAPGTSGEATADQLALVTATEGR